MDSSPKYAPGFPWSLENLESHEIENPIPVGLKSQAILVSCSVVVIQNLQCWVSLFEP